MNKKGQALVEFILIFPVFLLIVCTVIELCTINYQKLNLVNDLDAVTKMYLKNLDVDSYAKEHNLKLEIKENTNSKEFTVVKNLKIVTPILKLVYKDNQKLEEKRVLYDE